MERSIQLGPSIRKNNTHAQIAELATRGKVTSESGEQRDLTTKELRELSRQMYLPKRAEKELKLLEAQLQDEENLFLNEGERPERSCPGRPVCRAISCRALALSHRWLQCSSWPRRPVPFLDGGERTGRSCNAVSTTRNEDYMPS